VLAAVSPRRPRTFDVASESIYSHHQRPCRALWKTSLRAALQAWKDVNSDYRGALIEVEGAFEVVGLSGVLVCGLDYAEQIGRRAPCAD